ncbi:23S rRNA (adenine(2030)-N(6))-methyltransferase RlmJ [Aureimonas leprariae]|uniref:Ribosomal RNA large subunit methyltransferase J n=1 Tax=Plantimonas leprariae TaxID=2615207 RepID=A0A7V7TX42_9HYPH|nr:23S rRNA (adenine(2030)-N(6))-methyltransferase RlmJ [Aureimonas leprariae]KAB0680688.1 23S rRNA (adenine(2030)-N(6))-methyltransferase RlmJ [Aureimonas leprariae]
MNYRHAFHAGNFADVVKHALLVALVEYLKRKDKPFRVLDTHAGVGRYELGGDEARRTGEHLEGIAALRHSHAARAPELAVYLQAVDAEGTDLYPGSPLLVRRLLRAQDRLSVYELHPADAASLAALFAGDIQVKTFALDGWLALGAHLPPKEKRGLVLIDPPFEERGEVDSIARGLAAAHRRWTGGIYAVWYPIKREADRDRLHAALAATGIPDIQAAEFMREPFAVEPKLVGTGLAVVNAPYTFADEASRIMAILEQVLAKGDRATSRIVAVSPERP